MNSRIFLHCFRHMARHKGYAFINMAGLGIGLAVAMLIGLWIGNELSFNQQFSSPETLGTVLSTTTFNGESTTISGVAAPLAATLRIDFPEDFAEVSAVAYATHSLSTGADQLEEEGIWAEPGFIRMFLPGAVSPHALDDPVSALISESLASALFGKINPGGRLLRIDNAHAVKVAGVYPDFPSNSHFAGLNLILSWKDQANPGLGEDGWSNHHFSIFVRRRPGADWDALSKKISLVSKPHLQSDWERLSLQSFTREHLHDRFINGREAGGSIVYVRLFAAVALTVLLLACINFMNLSTARSEKRAREVGVKKAIGSGRLELILEFYSESAIYVFCSALLAVLLVMALLGRFELMAQTVLSVPFRSGVFWLLTIGFLLFTAFVAGSYPALYLSSFQPVKVLTNSFKRGKWSAPIRKGMVVTQFVVSITLVFCTLAILRQIRYAKDRPVGYGRSGLLVSEMSTADVHEHFEALRSELIKSGYVQNMEQSSSPATNVQNSMFGYDWEGRDPQTVTPIGTVFTGFDFGKTVGWQMKEGRDFRHDHPADSGAIILNEAAVRFFHLKNATGSIIRWHEIPHPVIGVIKDMVMESPYQPAEPTIFMLSSLKLHLMLIRVNPEKPMREALKNISAIYARYAPESPFACDFTDETYAQKFAAEDRVAAITSFFTMLAALISALGLFALASYVTEQRGREIGVRKVLGASVFRLWKMLTAEYLFLILLSVAISVPLGWYFSGRWLSQFVYRAPLSAWIVAGTVAAALAITMLTVMYHILRAAFENPVKRLKAD